MLIPAGWAPLWWVLLCAMGLLGTLRRLSRTLSKPVSNLVAAVASNLGIRVPRGPLTGSCKLLVLLLGLSLLGHEGGEYLQGRLLLRLEILFHGDVPVQAGLAW